MIETQIWETTKPVGEQYLGQRKAIDVFNEIKNELDRKIQCEDDEITYDYVVLDMDIKYTKAEFPKGDIVIYAKPGRSEGYMVNMIVLDEEKYQYFLGIKLWSMHEALIVSNLLTKIVFM